jgi:hypothetical protein
MLRIVIHLLVSVVLFSMTLSCAQHGPERTTVQAPLFGAYSEEHSVAASILGRAINPKTADASDEPTALMFGASQAMFRERQGMPFTSEGDRNRVLSSLILQALSTCSGKFGMELEPRVLSGVKLEVSRSASVAPEMRLYTADLADCCAHGDGGCPSNVITSAYYSELRLEMKLKRGLPVGEELPCTAATRATHYLSSPEPAAIFAQLDNKQNLTIRARGWNFVNAVPLRQVCQDWKRACRARCDDADERERSQYQCNRCTSEDSDEEAPSGRRARKQAFMR